MRVPGRGALKRVVLESVGWLLVVAGIAALILPGPGLIMLFGGLAILSQQYEWAARRMRPVEVRAKKAAADSVETWPRIIASTAGALVITGLGVLWTTRPAVPAWWPLEDQLWLPGGLATGLTLVASGLIALGLVGYSYRTYRTGDRPA
jgi:uncharacterized protein (TIGR02611 family)